MLPFNGASVLSQVSVIRTRWRTEPKNSRRWNSATRHSHPQRRDFSLRAPICLPGNGLPDILEMNGTVRYWRNLGGGRFDLPRAMRDAPAGSRWPTRRAADRRRRRRPHRPAGHHGPHVRLLPAALRRAWDRRSFRRYRQAPSFNLEDPEVRLVDLDGDGVTDAIRSGSRLECFFNDPRGGLEQHAVGRAPNARRLPQRQLLRPARQVGRHDRRRPAGHRARPRRQRRVLAQSRATATGASASHMRNSPASPTATTRSASCSATWTATAWPTSSTSTTARSRSGSTRAATAGATRSTSTARRRVRHGRVRLADLLGTGVSGVLWSADANGLSRQHLFFLDFTGGDKPYLLNEMDNHMGAVTRVDYAPSTRFYLDDQKRRRRAGDAAAVPGAGGRPRRGHRRDLARQAHHRVPLPPRLLGRRRAGVPRLRHGRAARHRDVRRLQRRPGLHGEEATFEPVDRQLFAPDAHQDLVPSGPVGDEFGDWQELDFGASTGRAIPHCSTHTEAVNAFLKDAARSPARATRRPAHAARQHLRTELYALDGTDRQDRPTPSPSTPTACAKDDPAGTATPSGRASSSRILSAAHDAVGARRRPDDAVHLHRRLRRLRPAGR